MWLPVVEMMCEYFKLITDQRKYEEVDISSENKMELFRSKLYLVLLSLTICSS